MRQRTRRGRARWLASAEAEKEAVGGDGWGTGDEHGDAGRGGGDRLEQAGAVQAADGAEQLPLGDLLARRDGRLPPAFVRGAQPQELLEVLGRRGGPGVRRRV